MPPLISVRTAETADIGPMHRIRLAVNENRLSDPGRISASSYVPYLASGCGWVAEINGAIAGFAILDPVACSVWALFVDPEAQGHGVGRALHEHMLMRSRERGLRQLTLTTGPDTRAARFYRELGWSEVGRTNGGEVLFERLV